MNQERLFQVIRAPHVSEKAAVVADINNQYVFRVALDASKAEVKAAVEKFFKVNVESVSTLRVKGKTKRNRFGFTTKPSWKKAYVTLAQGQEIDFATVE
ncbi:LSU ribosomal protein L23p (L23Ae) [Aequoribacter fuscus]|jgi:large subunit ribosomal protein L23|uniref:Large ribosomal subunit protein uL23 n=1 Tax=Aequoribacter fuscus TaxID=2518989 RepID=F3L634_9GAMM|nr:50S ribosomal protein L23 [Aequoribacter fuscus]EGG28206.1 LSU ribosomal protein L23p (L23Ae) [Aequoribacter fuscus]QHJ87123.1 50S ribosomal protein L23 [Aequoribacter fuscus]